MSQKADPPPPYPQSASSSGSSVDRTVEWTTHRGSRKCHELVSETFTLPLSALPTTSSAASTSSDVRADPLECEKSERKDLDSIQFFSGNPFVEKTTGIVHLYKQNQLTALETDGSLPDTLCILAVPATMTSRDLLHFLAASKDSDGAETIRNVRIIRDSSPNRYMVLLQFRSADDTRSFYDTYNATPYNSLEPHLCHLAYVAHVETMRESDGAACPMPGHTELPTCSVCLERMDESLKGVLTILCNHAFHAECIAQWIDASCPVCRYCQTPEVTEDQLCGECSRAVDLWICLICGHVGCGRYEHAHAVKHYQETGHTYSLQCGCGCQFFRSHPRMCGCGCGCSLHPYLQVGTQRVWDYAGDNYVHRLIQNKTDGKLVEVEEQCSNVFDPSDLAYEEKMDAVNLEYTYLLTSQLESQRNYYEQRILNTEKIARAEIDELEAKVRYLVAKCDSLEEEGKSESSEKVSLEKKLQQANAKLAKMSPMLKEELELNRCLRDNQSKWSARVDDLEHKLETVVTLKDKEIEDLQEQIRDLMFHFAAENQIAAVDGAAGGAAAARTHSTQNSQDLKMDIQEGTLHVPEPPPSHQVRRGRKHK